MLTTWQRWQSEATDSQPRPLWFEDGLPETQDDEDLSEIENLFIRSHMNLYDDNGRLASDERRVIQGRFLENLHIRLRRLHPIDENLADIEALTGVSHSMAIWWAGIGQPQESRSFYKGATIAWEHAVTLARDALDVADDVSDWQVLKRILGDRQLTEDHINRIWNRSEYKNI